MKNKSKKKIAVNVSKSRWSDFGSIKPVTRVIPNKKKSVKEREFVKSAMSELPFFYWINAN